MITASMPMLFSTDDQIGIQCYAGAPEPWRTISPVGSKEIDLGDGGSVVSLKERLRWHLRVINGGRISVSPLSLPSESSSNGGS
jgi:hypothetical protein